MTFAKVLYGFQWSMLGLMVLLLVAYRFRWLPFKPAFGGFALALLLLSLAAIVALVLFGLSYGPVAKEARSTAVFGFLLGLVPIVVMGVTVGKGFKVPAIHDISTNTSDNIAFVNAQSLRLSGENPIDMPKDTVVAQQEAFYKELKPLMLSLSPEQAYAKSLEISRQLGWQVVYEDADSLSFEAVDKTALFGFADDIAVRIAQSGDGSVVDTRSVSRVGKSDLGANAKRIQRFQEAFGQ